MTVTADAPAVDARALTKRYGRRRGVQQVSLTVQAGQICALLGPNGAGKTTTIRMLVGLSRPDAGHVQVLGRPTGRGAAVLASVGVLIDGPGLVPHLSGRRNLWLLWTAAGRPWPPPDLEDALALAGLDGALDDRVRTYSMGMRQRLMLAQALMGRPRLLVLDEPANGLDPGEQRALRQHLTRLAQGGTAVLISSHLLAEVQQLASHLVVMADGAVVAAGTAADLLGDDASPGRLEDVFLELVGDTRAAG